jgi:flagellar basal body-associated protein FliL
MEDLDTHDHGKPTEERKKKKMTVYVITGVFVLIVAVVVWAAFLGDAPEFGKEDVRDKAEARELLDPESGTPSSPE